MLRAIGFSLRFVRNTCCSNLLESTLTDGEMVSENMEGWADVASVFILKGSITATWRRLFYLLLSHCCLHCPYFFPTSLIFYSIKYTLFFKYIATYIQIYYGIHYIIVIYLSNSLNLLVYKQKVATCFIHWLSNSLSFIIFPHLEVRKTVQQALLLNIGSYEPADLLNRYLRETVVQICLRQFHS